MVHIPYKGGGPATTATVAGESQLIVGTPAALLPQLDAKRLRAFAVTSDTRLKRFPDLPTVAEAGIPGYEYRGWAAMLAPAASRRRSSTGSMTRSRRRSTVRTCRSAWSTSSHGR